MLYLKKKKERKTPGDIIILHLCTKSIPYYIIYSYWDIECDRLADWNKLHFASARTFTYTKLFAVHDHAHKNHVLMSSSCTGAKISAKTPLRQAVYKMQIRTNPQCLMLVIATFNSLFFKAIPCKSIQYWVPMSKVHASFWESSLHVFVLVMAGPF